MSVLERCPSYRESNKGSKERQGPTLGVRFTEVSVKRESTVVNNMVLLKEDAFFGYSCKFISDRNKNPTVLLAIC